MPNRQLPVEFSWFVSPDSYCASIRTGQSVCRSGGTLFFIPTACSVSDSAVTGRRVGEFPRRGGKHYPFIPGLALPGRVKLNTVTIEVAQAAGGNNCS